MEPQRFEDVDNVIAFARSLPDFPNRALVLDRLEQRNVNRYQEAMLSLNEALAIFDYTKTHADGASKQQIQQLIDRLARLEASDPVGG
jgi:hypothetical protein